jgi:hypothetical protein
MPDEKRTLIETFLPVEEISEEVKSEKAGRAPTFEMHYWWTRKPLVTVRAAVLGALLPSDYDTTDFKRLLGLSMEKRTHNFDINLEQLEKLRRDYLKVWGTENPVVLEFFANVKLLMSSDKRKLIHKSNREFADRYRAHTCPGHLKNKPQINADERRLVKSADETWFLNLNSIFSRHIFDMIYSSNNYCK